MKEAYIKPEVQAEEYKTVDIITTSDNSTNPPVFDDEGWINRWY